MLAHFFGRQAPNVGWPTTTAETSSSVVVVVVVSDPTSDDCVTSTSFRFVRLFSHPAPLLPLPSSRTLEGPLYVVASSCYASVGDACVCIRLFLLLLCFVLLLVLLVVLFAVLVLFVVVLFAFLMLVSCCLFVFVFLFVARFFCLTF